MLCVLQFQILTIYCALSLADDNVDPWWQLRGLNDQIAAQDRRDVFGDHYNMTVIDNPACRNDVELWTQSLNRYMEALLTQCGDNDTQCTTEAERTLAETMFAAQQADSFGRVPSNILGMNSIWQGSWEECVEVKAPSDPDYSTHFCWVTLVTPLTAMAMGQREVSEATCQSPMRVQWSVCMPATCDNQDVAKLYQTMNFNESMIRFCDVDCHPKRDTTTGAGFWVVVGYCVLAILLMIVSSVVDYATDVGGELSEVSKKIRSKTLMKCLLAFSVYTNGAEIMSVQKRPGQIECLHCIRAFSMTWVIVGHVLLHFLHTENLGELLKANSKFLNGVYTNPFFSVDSFLFISGLLLTYLFIKSMDRHPKQIRSPVYWALFYIHRILRLSPPYYLFIGFTTVMFGHFTVGPLTLDYLETAEPCRKTWWKNLLYINNLWGLEELCMGHSWYLALDMQIHIFAPLLLVPLFYSPIAGAVSAFLFIAMSTVVNYTTYFKYDSPATMNGFFLSKNTGTGTPLDFQQYLYFAPWIRCTPYIIGALTGYFLIKTKGKKLWMTWWLSVLLWVACFAINVGCVFSLYDYTNGDPMSTAERASYNNWSRIGWAIGLAWVVTACEKGWAVAIHICHQAKELSSMVAKFLSFHMAGPIKNFMELGVWAPLSRLTYCGYLVHYLIIVSMLALSRQPMHFVNMADILFVQSVPIIVATFFCAFLWSCAFEIPSCKLEKMFISFLVGGGKPRGQRTKPVDSNDPKQAETTTNDCHEDGAARSKAIDDVENGECNKDK